MESLEHIQKTASMILGELETVEVPEFVVDAHRGDLFPRFVVSADMLFGAFAVALNRCR